MNSWSSWAPPTTPRCRWGSFPAVSSSACAWRRPSPTDPKVLLCDEPLLSLDLQHQQGVSALINKQCRDADSAVVFVTHEINPIMDYVDRVLYLAGGRFRVGTPAEVMTTEVLSDLYDSHVEVIQANGRLIVVGLPDAATHHHEDAHSVAGEVG